MITMDAVSTTVTFIAKGLDYLKTNVAGHVVDTSLPAVTKLTRAEPLVVISQDCMNMEELPQLCSVLVNLFSSYYLQAAAIMTRVNNVEVVRVLDALNPDRDATGFLLQGRHTKATESFHTLVAENYTYSLPVQSVMVHESDRSAPGGIGTDISKGLFEYNNLAVGKLINLTITSQDQEGCDRNTTIPVNIRLAPRSLNMDSLIALFTHKKMDISFWERGRAAAEGRISFIKDFVFCEDLIREYRKAAIKDKSGTLQEIYRRAQNNRNYGLLTKNPSLQIASSMYVLSKDAAMAIEGKTGLRFSNPASRVKLLQDTYAMIVAIVDPDWEQVHFYYSGISQPSTLKLNMLKDAGKGKGPDVGDIMKSLLEGRAPTF